MASTCTIHEGPRQIGTASCEAASASLTSYTETDAVYSTHINHRTTASGGSGGRWVTVCITQAGVNVSRTWRTRILANNGSGTLTLLDACPFASA